MQTIPLTPVPLLPQAKNPHRPVDPQWTCQRSGECCTIPKELVMTKEEAQKLVFHAPPTITLAFRPIDDARFVAMQTGPCPLYVFQTCLVYEHRPYNCRRFACMRPDPTTERFEADGSNLMDRTLVSRAARRLAQKIQRKAQRWASQHGWN
jgi:Fe-S-cluster containining protein